LETGAKEAADLDGLSGDELVDEEDEGRDIGGIGSAALSHFLFAESASEVC
jgi:hypothetical protein